VGFKKLSSLPTTISFFFEKEIKNGEVFKEKIHKKCH
jgi:hypothetical protein